MKNPIRLAALALVAIMLLTGCSTDTGAPVASTTGPTPDAVVIVAGAHANMPAPQIPVELAPLLESAIVAQAPISVVADDGTPKVSFHTSGYAVSTANPEATHNDVTAIANTVIDGVRSVAADSDGNDLGNALAVARDQLAADGAVAGMIMVIDSGLTDRGYPQLTTPGILTAGNEKTVVDVAQMNGYVPVMPAGTTVYLVGLGYGTAPQPELTPAQRDAVRNVWRAFIEAAGATVMSIDKPRSGDGPSTAFTTGVVAPASYEELTFSHSDDGTLTASVGADVLFDWRRSELNDAAQQALVALRDFLAATPGAIRIVGHTDATGSDSENMTLSRARAESTKAWLVANGIDGARIATDGRGSQEPAVPDASTPEQLQQNRRVVVTVTPTAP